MLDPVLGPLHALTHSPDEPEVGIIPVFHRMKPSSERLNDLPKVTQQLSGMQTQARSRACALNYGSLLSLQRRAAIDLHPGRRHTPFQGHAECPGPSSGLSPTLAQLLGP